MPKIGQISIYGASLLFILISPEGLQAPVPSALKHI